MPYFFSPVSPSQKKKPHEESSRSPPLKKNIPKCEEFWLQVLSWTNQFPPGLDGLLHPEMIQSEETLYLLLTLDSDKAQKLFKYMK